MMPLTTLKELGLKIVIIPSDLQRAAVYAMSETLRAIRQDGNSAAVSDRMISFGERETIIGLEGYLELDRRYGV